MAWGRGKKGAPPYPFEVDDRTRQMLGSAGLGELAENLWAHQCQTCGGAFGDTRPAVHVDSDGLLATATLHHPDCHPARWDDTSSATPKSAASATITFICVPLLLPTVNERTGAEVWRPFLLVNPGLEQVILVERDGRWRVGTVDYYARYGLGGADAVLRMGGDAVPNAIASLTEDSVSVLLGDLRADWSAECTPEFVERVRELAGVAVVVSTALRPDHETLDLVHEFADAITDGQVAGGWVRLD